jgi:hypothetical protein
MIDARKESTFPFVTGLPEIPKILYDMLSPYEFWRQLVIVPVCKEKTVDGPFHFFTDTLKSLFVQPPVQLFLTATFSDSLTTPRKTFCTAVSGSEVFIKEAQNSLSIVEPVASNGRI